MLPLISGIKIVRDSKLPNEITPNGLSRRVRSRDERVPQVVPQRGALIRGPIVGGPSQPLGEAESITPKLMLRGLFQHLMTAIVLGLVVGGGAAAAAWFLTPAPYEAKALIQVKSEQQKLVFATADNSKNENNFVRNQLQLITSDIVLRKALARPGVADVDLFKTVENPRIYLRKHLKASNSRAPELIELTLTGEDPRGLATVVNAIHVAYMDEIVNVDAARRAVRLSDLKRLLQERTEQIRSKRNTMSKIADVVGASINTDALNLRQKTALESMSMARTSWFQKHIELLREESLLKGMDAQDDDAKASIPQALVDAEVEMDPEVQRLQEQIERKESLAIETEKRVSNKSDHPKVLEQRAQLGTLTQTLAELKSRIRPRIEEKIRSDLLVRSEVSLHERKIRVESLKKEEADLRKEFETLRDEAMDLGKGSFELEDKKEEIASLEKFSNRIQEEIHALEVELNAPPRVAVLYEAEPPQQRDIKRRTMATVGAGLGGFALVCVLIAYAEARLKRIMAVDDVSGKIRVMGQVPMIPAWASRSARAAKSKKGRFWHDMLTESVDAARTLLVHDTELDDMRIIMVASAMPSEGKTTLSCHIASSLARAGRKVVLVDCDLRRPNVHRVFNVHNHAGFCELVLGKAEIDDVIQPATDGGPAILSAGHLTAAISPLLGMEVTEQIFRALRERFEFVIVDTSPVMIVHDTLVVAQHTDAAILAVRKRVSRQPKVDAVINRLQSLEVPVLGTVAIGLDCESQDYGSGYYRGYSKYYAAKRPT